MARAHTHTHTHTHTQPFYGSLDAEVIRFCRSCNICQRTIAKGRVPNVLLGKMPIIDTPFDRIAVDLVGPICTPTGKGN